MMRALLRNVAGADLRSLRQLSDYPRNVLNQDPDSMDYQRSDNARRTYKFLVLSAKTSEAGLVIENYGHIGTATFG